MKRAHTDEELRQSLLSEKFQDSADRSREPINLDALKKQQDAAYHDYLAIRHQFALAYLSFVNDPNLNELTSGAVTLKKATRKNKKTNEDETVYTLDLLFTLPDGSQKKIYGDAPHRLDTIAKNFDDILKKKITLAYNIDALQEDIKGKNCAHWLMWQFLWLTQKAGQRFELLDTLFTTLSFTVITSASTSLIRAIDLDPDAAGNLFEAGDGVLGLFPLLIPKAAQDWPFWAYFPGGAYALAALLSSAALIWKDYFANVDVIDTNQNSRKIFALWRALSWGQHLIHLTPLYFQFLLGGAGEMIAVHALIKVAEALHGDFSPLVNTGLFWGQIGLGIVSALAAWGYFMSFFAEPILKSIKHIQKQGLFEQRLPPRERYNLYLDTAKTFGTYMLFQTIRFVFFSLTFYQFTAEPLCEDRAWCNDQIASLALQAAVALVTVLQVYRVNFLSVYTSVFPEDPIEYQHVTHQAANGAAEERKEGSQESSKKNTCTALTFVDFKQLFIVDTQPDETYPTKQDWKYIVGQYVFSALILGAYDSFEWDEYNPFTRFKGSLIPVLFAANALLNAKNIRETCRSKRELSKTMSAMGFAYCIPIWLSAWGYGIFNEDSPNPITQHNDTFLPVMFASTLLAIPLKSWNLSHETHKEHVSAFDTYNALRAQYQIVLNNSGLEEYTKLKASIANTYNQAEDNPELRKQRQIQKENLAAIRQLMLLYKEFNELTFKTEKPQPNHISDMMETLKRYSEKSSDATPQNTRRADTLAHATATVRTLSFMFLFFPGLLAHHIDVDYPGLVTMSLPFAMPMYWVFYRQFHDQLQKTTTAEDIDYGESRAGFLSSIASKARACYQACNTPSTRPATLDEGQGSVQLEEPSYFRFQDNG